MPNWGMNPEPLHAAGGSISKLETDARTAGKGFLDSVADAKGSVHHSVVSNALDSYHGRWTPAANRLAANVDSAGSQVKNTATTGVSIDDETRTELTRPLTQLEGQQPAVSRPINA